MGREEDTQPLAQAEEKMMEFSADQMVGLGLRGSDVIKDATPNSHTGEWWKIVPYEATVFATLTDGKSGDSSLIEGESIPANHVLTGKFTKIILTSGACIAYRTGENDDAL